MNQRIIYQNDEGGVSIIIPTPEALTLYTINQIAKKDVPDGKAYKIVDVTDIPIDREFRNAWEVDAADLTDGVGAKWSVIPKETTDD
jgi:hypothetical protein